MSILGTRVVRSEDVRFLTEGGKYTADLVPTGSVWATFVRSTEPHARIESIDTTEAAALDGVIGIYTATDLDLGLVPPDMAMVDSPMKRSYLADDVVRFVGEAVAVILSETYAQGEDAVDLVVVGYDPLPVVIDPREAAKDETILHETVGTNVAMEIPDAPVDFSGCDVVVRREIVNQRMSSAPIEPQASACRFTDDGRLEMWTISQGPHPIKAMLTAIYGLPPDQVRVVSPDVGGGFGAKSFLSPESL
jgi:carbon-monoxide dehydrogenase large subunit